MLWWKAKVYKAAKEQKILGRWRSQAGMWQEITQDMANLPLKVLKVWFRTGWCGQQCHGY